MSSTDSAERMIHRTSVSAGALLLLPFAVAVVFFAVFSVNAPVSDDFDAILRFLNQASPEKQWPGWGAILSFHNEHRIAVTRLAAWLSLTGFERVSFSGLAAVGNLLLILLAGILICESRRSGLSGYWLIPIPCILLAPQAPDNSLGAMQALQNFGVHAFAGLTFVCWRYQKLLAVVFGMIAALTSASGLFVLPILSTFGLCSSWIESRRSFTCTVKCWLSSGYCWVAAASATVWYLYFQGFQPVQGHPSVIHALRNPIQVVRFAAALAGMPVRRFGESVPELAGFGLIVLLLVTLTVTDWRKHSVILQFVIFELAALAAVSLARSGFGIQAATGWRFRIIALTLLAGIYHLSAASLQQRLKERWNFRLSVTVAVAAIIFQLGTARDHLPDYRLMSQQMQAEVAHDLESGKFLMHPDPESALTVAVESDRRGVFDWPAASQNSSGESSSSQ